MHKFDSPEGKANLAAIESKLGELDDLFLQFCSQQDYRFSRSLNIYPKRRLWRRSEIDRFMDLEMATGFQDSLDRGFYPEFPWSLYARGSLCSGADPDIRVLSRPIFEHVPHCRLAFILANSLDRGLHILNTMTESEIRQHGEKWGRRAEPGDATR